RENRRRAIDEARGHLVVGRRLVAADAREFLEAIAAVLGSRIAREHGRAVLRKVAEEGVRNRLLAEAGAFPEKLDAACVGFGSAPEHRLEFLHAALERHLTACSTSVL